MARLHSIPVAVVLCAASIVHGAEYLAKPDLIVQ